MKVSAGVLLYNDGTEKAYTLVIDNGVVVLLDSQGEELFRQEGED